MVFDIDSYRSHPDKSLLCHVNGVMTKVNSLTNSKLAELVAIFHDLGKMNPNFQNKLLGNQNNGYDKHSYLSAFAFFCMALSNKNNRDVLQNFLECQSLNANDIIGITTLIAKHHGNLPDFCPIDYGYSGRGILSKNEVNNLFAFVNNFSIPFYEYAHSFFEGIDDFTSYLNDKNIQAFFADRFVFQSKSNLHPLDYYLDLQFSFASILQADKADAACFDNFIDTHNKDVLNFCKNFHQKLDSYLQTLNQKSDLNKLRTQIREEAVSKIQVGLEQKNRIFELTSPTGSGKTLILLSLASEIIKRKGAKRIIYGLPFLSITEQVEAEILRVFADEREYIQRIDSKSENKRFEEVQEELDNTSSEELITELDLLEFQENTFSYPFVITTFVRFFETLLSNRNSELLKLPNFSHCIFLLDEIQALPPRLYGFFVAYLTKFCEKFDSYAIVSTATQPNFELPSYDPNIRNFFNDYKKPFSLLPLSYFDNKLFNRYSISVCYDCITINKLKDSIKDEGQSVLVILNTIDDTNELYSLLKEELNEDELILLNTHFTPRDRKLKIYLAKRRLRANKKVVVISTQLIEAGVDIDFPILYRDFATISSIIQSAGRCNRNGKLSELGKVKLFRLTNKNKVRSELIYREKDKELLDFTKASLLNQSYNENELLSVQKSFFDKIQSRLCFAKYGENLYRDFLKDIKECMFDKIGHFQLIEEIVFGEELQYYVAKNDRDNSFEILLQKHEELLDILKEKSKISIIKIKKKEMGILQRRMSNRIVQIRLKKSQTKPLLENQNSYFNLFKIDSKCYSFQYGVDLKGSEFII